MAAGVVASSSTQLMGKEVVMQVHIFLEHYEATGALGAFVVRSEQGNEYRCTECRIDQRQEAFTRHTLQGPMRLEGARHCEMDAVLTDNTGRERLIRDDWQPDERQSLLDEILK